VVQERWYGIDVGMVQQWNIHDISWRNREAGVTVDLKLLDGYNFHVRIWQAEAEMNELAILIQLDFVPH